MPILDKSADGARCGTAEVTKVLEIHVQGEGTEHMLLPVSLL